MITKVQNLVPILKPTNTFGVYYNQELKEVTIARFYEASDSSGLPSLQAEQVRFPLSKIFQLDRRVRKVIERFYRKHEKKNKHIL